MTFKKKRIGELYGTPIVAGKKNYATEDEYYITLNDDNTYQRLELRTKGDQFKVIFIGNHIYIGKFYIEDLPTLDGFNDYGKVAYIKDTDKTAYWDGYGWTYVDGSVVTPHYLTFTANLNGSSIGFIVFNNNYELPEDYTKPSLQYSVDGGKTWQDYDLQISDDIANAVIIDLDEGESVMFRGNNENLAYYILAKNDTLRMMAHIEGSIAASGDVTSLLNGVGGDVAIPQYCYTKMFYYCTDLTQAPALPATTLANNCYQNMFSGCTGLTRVPILPAVTLVRNCYNSMFQNCTGLTQTPVLPATVMAQSCYKSMFAGCTGLTKAPALPAPTLANECYSEMFAGCTGLTKAPALSAITLATSCYQSMFAGCTGLTKAPALPAPTLASNCYKSMFQDCTSLTQAPVLHSTGLTLGCYQSMFAGCTSITSHDVADLNNSSNTFDNNSSCVSLTIHKQIPPNINSNTITGLKDDCIIYVPVASVDAYKAKQYWSARASYIQAIS